MLIHSNGGLDASTVLGSVSEVDGKTVYREGVYVDTEERRGGICVVDVADDDAARFWAGRIVVAVDWPQEIDRFRN